MPNPRFIRPTAPPAANLNDDEPARIGFFNALNAPYQTFRNTVDALDPVNNAAQITTAQNAYQAAITTAQTARDATLLSQQQAMDTGSTNWPMKVEDFGQRFTTAEMSAMRLSNDPTIKTFVNNSSNVAPNTVSGAYVYPTITKPAAVAGCQAAITAGLIAAARKPV